MIVLFTSNSSGGMLQFSIQVMCELKKLNIDVCCFAPEEACAYIEKKYMPDIILYKNFKFLKLQILEVKCTGELILKKNPDLVWYMDDADNCMSISIGLYLAGKVKQMSTLHDLQMHPTYVSGNLKGKIASCCINLLRRKFLKKMNFILLMSNENYELGVKKFPQYTDKMLELTLGAHLLEGIPTKLKELNNLDQSFLLFFGRLDKYKGISTMLKAYALNSHCSEKLVIAGEGILTEEEKKLINENKQIILIKRYIEDGEMTWLFKHAQAVVLPYIEASQSGIIPIAYLCGVPVITSDVAGLVQYVEDQKTGIICRKIDDYAKAFQNISQTEVRQKMSHYCKQYYEEHMDWQRNIKKILDIVLSK